MQTRDYKSNSTETVPRQLVAALHRVGHRHLSLFLSTVSGHLPATENSTESHNRTWFEFLQQKSAESNFHFNTDVTCFIILSKKSASSKNV